MSVRSLVVCGGIYSLGGVGGVSNLELSRFLPQTGGGLFGVFWGGELGVPK